MMASTFRGDKQTSAPEVSGSDSSTHEPQPDPSAEKVVLKVILIGGAEVGKTSLIHQFKDGKVDSTYKPTIGVDFMNKEMTLDIPVKLQVWDTAGQEQYRPFTTAYNAKARAVVFVYDVTKKSSFDELSALREAFMADFLERSDNSEVDASLPIFYVGNKVDMAFGFKKEVTPEMVKTLHGVLPVFELSAKNETSAVARMFEIVATQALGHHRALMANHAVSLGPVAVSTSSTKATSTSASPLSSSSSTAADSEYKVATTPLAVVEEIQTLKQQVELLKKQIASQENTIRQMEQALSSLGVWPPKA